VIDMTTSRPRRARHGPWLVAGLASCAVLVPAVTAAATWQNSTITFIEFRDVCRDGIRFGAAIRADHGDTSPVFRDWAVAAQPVPATWADRSTLVMRTRIGIPRAPYGATVPTENEGNVPVSHLGSFTLRYRNGPLKLAPVALNLRDGNVHSGVNHADVKDCYLFAPIDVQPGMSPNQVPIGHGQVSVAVLATATMRADRLKPKTFRFGPKKAAARGSALRDVNGDHRLDLVLRFGSVAAGLTCKTKVVHLTGQTPSGGKLEASDRVVPTGCLA
jgi:hypothetical protein